ncbi:MAG: GIY-YIG nuclease family protein [Oscillospiraceae bacterium]|nr:GIY-YIG nuclease family protein [Oscillospiraceae bacterium]
MNRAYTYILRCGDGSLYTGWTNDLEQRIRAHSAGHGGKYTSSHLPVELIWYEPCADRSAAMRREAAIKRMSRAEKLALIQSANATGADGVT